MGLSRSELPPAHPPGLPGITWQRRLWKFETHLPLLFHPAVGLKSNSTSPCKSGPPWTNSDPTFIPVSICYRALDPTFLPLLISSSSPSPGRPPPLSPSLLLSPSPLLSPAPSLGKLLVKASSVVSLPPVWLSTVRG